MKPTIGLMLALVVALALTGCSLFGPPDVSFIGSALRVSSDGYLREEVVYQVGTDIHRFTEAGVYEYTEEEYELEGDDIDGDSNFGEGWVATFGERYTYSIDADNLTITLRQTHELVNGEWIALDPATDFEVSFNAYFGENKFSFEAYVALAEAENTFVFTQTENFDDGTREVSTTTYVIDMDTSTWSLVELDEEYSSAGSLIAGTDRQRSGTFTVLPDGARFRRGETVSFRLVQTLFRRLQYDTAAGEWNETNADGDTDYYGDTVFTHMGDFILEEGESSYRSVIGY